MVSLSSKLRSVSDDLFGFFDFWNIIGGVGVLIIGGVSYKGGFTTQSVLVAVTGFYAFIAFNQMREYRQNRKPSNPIAVRPCFRRENDTDVYDFGLKNFGDSPALNLRLVAILREGDNIVNTLNFSSKDWHFHLEKESFLSLTSAISEHQTFEDLNDIESPVFDNYEQKFIELYYTFESIDGTQYPRNWSNPISMDMDEVIEKAKTPRIVKLAEIREKCT